MTRHGYESASKTLARKRRERVQIIRDARTREARKPNTNTRRISA